MPLTYMGISTWIENNRGEELPQYAVKPCGRRSMQCWIPVSERSQFKIMWKVLNAPGTDLDLLVFPFFDGIPLCACSWTKDQVNAREVGELGHHPTGRSSIRQYEFGHREVTDTEDFQTGRPRAVITELNTIKIRFAWGYQKNVDCAGLFSNPTEVAPIHETEIKAMRGLSGSACLSQDEINTRYKYSSCEFLPEAGVKSTTFIFRYAPLDWLRAHKIIERLPRINIMPKPKICSRRNRNSTAVSEATITSEYEINDDDIVFVKRVVRPTAPYRKKIRLEKSAHIWRIPDAR